MSPSKRPTGKTKDAGWEIGVSRTVKHQIDDVWAALMSPTGMAIWLGEGVSFEGTEREPYETTDGTVGELRTLRPGNRVRLTWQPSDWLHDSIVQIALLDKGEKTGVTFHQEQLVSNSERERQRSHWQNVAVAFTELLDGAEHDGE